MSQIICRSPTIKPTSSYEPDYLAELSVHTDFIFEVYFPAQRFYYCSSMFAKF